MATKQFAVPLDSNSIQTGDINFKALVDDGSTVTFQITNANTGSTNELNLITKKNGSTKDHKFSANVSGSSMSAQLTAGQMAAVYGDAKFGDWDYIEAEWTVGAVDTPSNSNQYEIQSGHTYNMHGWPPKTS
jgi:hypothetical protein